MFIPHKNKATSNKKQEAFSNEVTTNGKNHRECSCHVICYVTKSSRSSIHSLLDRGDNRGVTGSVARVIETNPNLKVDICGVGDHQISAIPLVTSGGVTTTVTGEVTVNMHQHEFHGKNKTIHYPPPDLAPQECSRRLLH